MHLSMARGAEGASSHSPASVFFLHDAVDGQGEDCAQEIAQLDHAEESGATAVELNCNNQVRLSIQLQIRRHQSQPRGLRLWPWPMRLGRS